jgi:ribokinase
MAAWSADPTVIDLAVVGGVFREILDGDVSPRLRYGGSGLTASVAAARLGAEVALLSYVGTEDEETVRAELELAGVNARFLQVLPGACGTFLYPAHEVSERPWPMYRPAEAVPKSGPLDLPEAKVVLAFGIPDFDPVAEGWLDSTQEDTILIWDRQGWLSRSRDAFGIIALAPARKIYLANEGEALEEAQLSSYDELISRQPPAGFQAAIIKRGVRGVTVVEHVEKVRQVVSVEAFPVMTSSTVGSGDVFAGAFAAVLARGRDVLDSAQWGCAAASVSIQSGVNLLPDDAETKVAELLNRSGRPDAEGG